MSTFIIDGEPTGKARPRVTRYGTHNTEKTVLYENLVKISYKQQCSEFYATEPLKVTICACYGIPKSASKKARERMLIGECRPTKKPDTDNIAKIIMDSCNGLAFTDDAQVAELHVIKTYGEKPLVQVHISPIGGAT